jgi:hypothetical protein
MLTRSLLLNVLLRRGAPAAVAVESPRLICSMREATVGPLLAPWEFTLRLHHRSVAWSPMGEEGGMNAVGLGMRHSLGASTPCRADCNRR